MIDIKDTMESISQGISSSFDQNEMVTYNIWAAAVSTTRAFEKVEVKINAQTSRIFVVIHLRWWGRVKLKRMNIIRDIWLKKASSRVKQQIPSGWNFLCYFAKEGNEG
jgi:hypothetical protein